MASLPTSILRTLTAPEGSSADPAHFGSSQIAATAAVAVATLRRACELEGASLRDQVVVIRGAGARGLAVARALRGMYQVNGMTAREAAARVFVVDGGGLLIDTVATGATRRFATPVEALAGWSFRGNRPDFVETIANTGATALIGLSGRSGAITVEAIQAMCAQNERPIVLPLSWPDDRREASTAQVVEWSRGAARVAGPEIGPGQGHAAGGAEGWALSGIALGAIIAEAAAIDEDMVLAAARAVHAQTAEQADRIAPSDAELAATSERVAVEVVRAALRSGSATNPALSFDGVEDYVRERMAGGANLPQPQRDHGWEAESPA